MNYAALNWARDIEFTGKHATKMRHSGLAAVLFNLAGYKNEITSLCNPSVKMLAKDQKVSRQTIQSILKELCRMNVIEIARPGVGTRPTEYTLVGSDGALSTSPEHDNVVSILMAKTGCKSEG
jgi:hypothetical protein